MLLIFLKQLCTEWWAPREKKRKILCPSLDSFGYFSQIFLCFSVLFSLVGSWWGTAGKRYQMNRHRMRVGGLFLVSVNQIWSISKLFSKPGRGNFRFLIRRPQHHHSFWLKTALCYTRDMSTLKESNFSSLYQYVLCWLYPAPPKYRVVQASNTIFNNSLLKLKKIFPAHFLPNIYI